MDRLIEASLQAFNVYSDYSQSNDVQYKRVKNNTLVLQGSAGWEDWFMNLWCWKTDWHGARAHYGFVEQASRIWNLQPADLYVGHSLGGAIAQLLAHLNRKPYIVFGSPRVGSGLWHHHNSISVIGRGDSVCHYPWKIFGYDDAPNTLRIGKKSWFVNDHVDYIKELENERNIRSACT